MPGALSLTILEVHSSLYFPLGRDIFSARRTSDLESHVPHYSLVFKQAKL